MLRGERRGSLGVEMLKRTRRKDRGRTGRKLEAKRAASSSSAKGTRRRSFQEEREVQSGERVLQGDYESKKAKGVVGGQTKLGGGGEGKGSRKRELDLEVTSSASPSPLFLHSRQQIS